MGLQSKDESGILKVSQENFKENGQLEGKIVEKRRRERSQKTSGDPILVFIFVEQIKIIAWNVIGIRRAHKGAVF